jgi:hypothetical protein
MEIQSKIANEKYELKERKDSSMKGVMVKEWPSITPNRL